MDVHTEWPIMLKLSDELPKFVERDILRCQCVRRYVATWWSEEHKSVLYADGEIWRAETVDEDAWVWWTCTLTHSRPFDFKCLGFDRNLPLHVLLLDLDKRDVWLAPIEVGFEVLRGKNPHPKLVHALTR